VVALFVVFSGHAMIVRRGAIATRRLDIVELDIVEAMSKVIWTTEEP